MIDIRILREDPALIKAAVRNKNATIDAAAVDRLLELDGKRRQALNDLDEARRQRNDLAESLKDGRPTPEQIAQGKDLKEQVIRLEGMFKEIDDEYDTLLKHVPNIPTGDVPIGTSEADNQVVKQVGEKPVFAFTPKNHWQLAETLGLIDKERAAKVAGARFAYLKGELVRLHFALVQFGLQVLTSRETLAEIANAAGLQVNTKPFIPVLPPLMIRTEPYDAMDRLEPREERYKIDGEELWLQGSAEHVLGSMHMGETLDESQLPLRYAGYATSFRREAGTYGKDMEGIMRLHQFDKLEMESLTTADDSLAEHHFMVAIQEHLMQQLGLPYQVVMKCTADIGKPNARGVDIDVWLPGQDKYRETHTADYMTDYQARRLQTRVRRAAGPVELVHTNDATAFSQRPLIAILENYQQADGSIVVPEVLRSLVGFETISIKERQ